MKDYEILDALGGIDADYIESASRDKKSGGKYFIRILIPAAACLCLIVGALAVSGRLGIGAPGDNVFSAEIDPKTDGEDNAIIPLPDEEGDAGSVNTSADCEQIDPQQDTPPAESSAAFEPDNHDPEAGEPVTPMISSFDGGEPLALDMAVIDGAFFLSPKLEGALAQYGDGARYRVLVELFRGGVQIGSDSEEAKSEMQRFADEGYTVALEKIFDGYVWHYYFTLHADAAQLRHFPAKESYGYALMLYDEYFGTQSETETAFNAATVNGGFAEQ